MQETLFRWLASSAGDYTLVEHPAVHTIDEALIHVPAMPGLMVKNLFVRDENGRRHFLVIVPFDKPIRCATRPLWRCRMLAWLVSSRIRGMCRVS